MKSQRNEYSERFGFLSNEMSSLRGLANDIQSQRQTSQRGFNTQKHTANKPSLVDNNQITSQKTQKGGPLPPTSNNHKKTPSVINQNSNNIHGFKGPPEVTYDAYDELSSSQMMHPGPNRI